jgi:hypothetical protein
LRVPGKIAVWVLCLVFLSVIILESGNYSYVQDNSSTNFGPSGTSGFLELVKKTGYKVDIDNGRAPKVAPTMVIPVSKQHQKSFTAFLGSVTSETTIITYVIPEEDRKQVPPTTIKSDVTHEAVGQMQPIRLKSEQWQMPQLDDGETAVVQVVTKDKIRLIQVLDSACITNRYLDQVNNASIAIGLIGMAAKPGSTLTYVGSFSSRASEDSLLEKLGTPFKAAWSQLMILVLVIFLTLSVRFGMAPETRAAQRGGRELVDGLAWMTRRKRNSRWALRAVFDRVLAELERRHRVGREQIIQRPDLYLTPESAVILKDVEAATMDDITEQEAIRYAKALKTIV